MSEGAISQWVKRAKQDGVAGLASHPLAEPQRAKEQRLQFLASLAQGAAARSFRGDVWGSKRMRDMIARQFGVCYHRDHVQNLLHEI